MRAIKEQNKEPCIFVQEFAMAKALNEGKFYNFELLRFFICPSYIYTLLKLRYFPQFAQLYLDRQVAELFQKEWVK